jgi:hypothetical protein
MGETVTVTRRTAGSVDDYGNPTYSTTTVTFNNCLVGWGSTDEPALADENPVSTQMTLYMPAGSVIEDGDIFNIRGDMFVKDGFAQQWISMLNVAKGVVVILRRHDG